MSHLLFSPGSLLSRLADGTVPVPAGMKKRNRGVAAFTSGDETTKCRSPAGGNVSQHLVLVIR